MKLQQVVFANPVPTQSDGGVPSRTFTDVNWEMELVEEGALAGHVRLTRKVNGSVDYGGFSNIASFRPYPEQAAPKAVKGVRK